MHLYVYLHLSHSIKNLDEIEAKMKFCFDFPNADSEDTSLTQMMQIQKQSLVLLMESVKDDFQQATYVRQTIEYVRRETERRNHRTWPRAS